MPFRKHPSPGTVIACVALFVALGGPAEAAKLISGSKIKRNTITSKQIKNRTITSGDISSRTLSSLKAKANGVTSAQIVDGSVTLADLAAGSVTGNQVVDHSLSAIDLAAGTISPNELATGSVTDAKLANDAVTNRAIKTGAVTKGSIGSNDVGTEELIDRDVRGNDMGADTVQVTLVPIATNNTCNSVDVAIPAQAAAAARLALVGQVDDNVRLSARVTGDTNLRVTACTATGPFSGGTYTLPYLVIGS